VVVIAAGRVPAAASVGWLPSLLTSLAGEHKTTALLCLILNCWMFHCSAVLQVVAVLRYAADARLLLRARL
jgi:hypothetical protein